jgi:hypothetical protein
MRWNARSCAEFDRPACRWLIGITLCATVLGVLYPERAAAIPVFARIYDKPCGTCHTLFPQLNPDGETFRAHGFHGLPPAVEPLKVGSLLDVPGTLPLALYFQTGEDVTKVDAPAQRNPTNTHFNLDLLSLLAGGELGPHLAFLIDYRVLESEPDTGDIEWYSVPYQAYFMAHAERWGWLANLKGGWYELPLGVSPTIHRLSARPYLVYETNACTLLGAAPPHGACERQPTLETTQLGTEISALQPDRGFSWTVGYSNWSNSEPNTGASENVYLHVSQALGLHRLGLFAFYSPNIAGGDVSDHTYRIGPDLNFYSRRLRLLGQFLAEYESNPTGHDQALWYYGGFLEGDYRLTTTLLSLLRFDYAWAPTFDDTMQGGDTRVRRRLWEFTGGAQWAVLQNVKLVAELTYGEDHESVSDRTVKTWAGTIRLVTAFWLLAPPGVSEWMEGQRTP